MFQCSIAYFQITLSYLSKIIYLCQNVGLEVLVEEWLSPLEMDTVIRVQILYEGVYI